MHPTKRRLIDAGLRMLLEEGYSNLGIQGLLGATGIPKGSFYHHFRDKEDFALAVIETYLADVHAVLDQCVFSSDLPPLERIRRFFALVEESYKQDGYLGCLMGALGQELSGVSDVFRRKIEECFSSIADRLEVCFEQARGRGEVQQSYSPRQLAELMVDCWEGAALRSRLRRSPDSLEAMVDFFIRSVA